MGAGVLLLKFWLHISPKTQLRRFNQRESDPKKRHKITEEDWRNRAQRPAYERAIAEMLARTGATQARWRLIPAESKHYARVKVLRSICNRLRRELSSAQTARAR